MSSPFTLKVLGAEIEAARFKTELRAFKLEMRKQMRVAASVVKRDVQSKVESVFPTNTTAHKRSGATLLGPLRKKIRARVFDSKFDVVGLIRPAASAFYGRFQETGLNVQRKSRSSGGVFTIRNRKAARGSHPFHLARKPFLEPVAEADASKVTDIIGDSYGVFYRGGA